MSLLDELPNRCSIYRKVRTVDGMSGNIDTPVLEQSNVECWRQSANSSEVTIFQKQDITVSCKIYFSENPQVTEQHSIVITKMNGEAVTEEFYDVVSYAVPDAGAGLGVLYRVMVNTSTGRTN